MTAAHATQHARPHPGPVHVDFRAGTREPPSVTVRPTMAGPWLVLEIEGQMDLQVAALLHGTDAQLVVFDLHKVTFMDGSGLSAIEETQRHTASTGGCVRLVALSRPVRRLLMLAGAAQSFPLFDTVDEATSTPLDPAGQPEVKRHSLSLIRQLRRSRTR
jgi:anti-anti-sigma factor